MSGSGPGMSQTGGASGGASDPLKNFQTSFQQLSDEFARLTSSTEALRTEQARLSAETDRQKAALSAEITELTAQRDTVRSELEVDKKADEWWRKKEEALPRRSASDATGRATRAAYLSDEKCKTLTARIEEIEAEHESAMEAERSIAAGLRDRIGRIEGRLRAQQTEAESARAEEEARAKELREMEERYTREKGKWGTEVQDLKAALREERRIRGEKEEEVDRLNDALRNAVEEARRLKSVPSAATAPSRALTPLQLNIPRPQTPPRSTTAFNPKSPSSVPHTPKSLAKAYAYLDKRHTESQAQNRHLEAALQKAQNALREIREQHEVDREKFVEWRKIEDERSQARKRKREEKRRERGESGVGSGSEAGKRRKSEGVEGRVLIQASGESAASRQGNDDVEAEEVEEVEARTSQTVEDDADRAAAGQAVEAEEEPEESQEYCSPEDLRVPSQAISTSQRQPMPMGISQQLDMAPQAMSRTSSRDRPMPSQRRGSNSEHSGSQRAAPRQASQSQRGQTRGDQPALQESQRASTPGPRDPLQASASEIRRSTSRTDFRVPTAPAQGRASLPARSAAIGGPSELAQGRGEADGTRRLQPTAAAVAYSNGQRREIASFHVRSSYWGDDPATRSSCVEQPSAARPARRRPNDPPQPQSRRSVSPHKTPAPIPGAVRTTKWLGGGSLVRSGSRSSVLTTADPFDLSPPEAAESSRAAGPSKSTGGQYSTPSTKPSLVRDRGETSLRKAALTRFPSDMSASKGHADSPQPRTVSRSRLAESATASSSSLGPAGVSQVPDLGLEGLSPADKARRLKQLNKLSASEKREVYKGYKQEGGRYLAVDQVRRPVTEGYEIDPAKNEGMSHAFHDVKRGKESRKCMHGGDCELCHEWYAAIGPIPKFNQAPAFGANTTTDEDEEEGIRRHQNMVSRHRETWVKPPTPPGFWAIGFPTTQEVEAQNKKADAMEREKEERLLKDASAANSKWRKKT